MSMILHRAALLGSTLAMVACYPSRYPDADAAQAGEEPYEITLGLIEAAVTNPELAEQETTHAELVFDLIDPQSVIVAADPEFNGNFVNCEIFTYDVAAGEGPPPDADAGPIQISGSEAGPFTCAHQESTGEYLCASDDAAAAGAMPMAGSSATPNAEDNTIALVVAGADFSGISYGGMGITLSGFADERANGDFQILANGSDNSTLILANSKGLEAASSLSADSNYQTFLGPGSIPGGYNFLGDGSEPVVFKHEEHPNLGAFDVSLKPNGDGFALDAASVQPHAIPTDGSEAFFSCGDTCGAASGAIKGIMIIGETTDGDITGLSPDAMPEPVGKFATFECATVVEEWLMSEEMMALIMGTNPTRIKTAVTYANADIETIKDNGIFAAAQGVVGYTDP